MSHNDNGVPAPEQVLRFQVKRNVTNLFRRFLETLERRKDGHEEALSKLRRALPAQYSHYVDLADDFTDQEAERLRKEVLTMGNDCLRGLNEEIDKLEISLKS